ncbi:hypothetical protein RP20_CCG003620 [Aedes albopictus]|nr:hypothetical protein RP20_CCG003620 [Aedes albopictus]
MGLSVQAGVVIFAIISVGSQLLKAHPTSNYYEQNDMILHDDTNPSSISDNDATIFVGFDRRTPAPENSTEVLAEGFDDGMIDKLIYKMHRWMQSSFSTVRSWGHSMKRKFCSYECFQQYAKVQTFCNTQNELQQ